MKEASHKWQKINNPYAWKIFTLFSPKEMQLKLSKMTIFHLILGKYDNVNQYDIGQKKFMIFTVS